MEPFFDLSTEVAIRPSFCWNSHQDTWQTGGVWSQFDSGLKSCQDDVYACTNFMAHPDAAFAGKPQQEFEADKLNRAALAARTSTTLHVAPGHLQGIVLHIDHATPEADHFLCLSQLCADVVLVGAFSNAASLSAVLSGAVSLSNRARLVQVCLMVMGSMVALLPCTPARTSPSGCQLTATPHPRIPKGASRPWRVCAVKSSEALHGRSCAALMPAAVV